MASTPSYFDETTDVLGTGPVLGHPGVIGLWLIDYTLGTVLDEDGFAAADPTSYTVTDLRPDNGYM